MTTQSSSPPADLSEPRTTYTPSATCSVFSRTPIATNTSAHPSETLLLAPPTGDSHNIEVLPPTGDRRADRAGEGADGGNSTPGDHPVRGVQHQDGKDEPIPAQFSAPPARAPPPRPSFAHAQAAAMPSLRPSSPFTLQMDLPSIARPAANVTSVQGSLSSPLPTQTLKGHAHEPEAVSQDYPLAVSAAPSAPSACDAPTTTPPRATPPRMTPPSKRPHHPTTTPPLALPTQKQVPTVSV